ncbi:hypothetical protein HNQ96_005408 [Aminobacter lissarensis]|uniref:Uncharacterized protein n=1 Tax=Aminobacter carboxidus TaxID=376165 RepID=A0A8E1WJA2_9HYPH|nr:hypothetical protein [Aminobacter lissarensis]MBB6469518.1 hypothetical protein [Aminobacter lissarensis]
MGSLNHKLAQHENRRLDRTMEGGHERPMMSEDMPQLFYPGMPERTEPWTGDYEIVWSIYIRCNNRQKLRRVHIPALEAIIGQPHGGRGWVIEKENSSPEELRLMATEILAGPYSDAMLLSLFRKLYALKPHWHLTARLNAEHPRGVYVMAAYAEKEPSSAVPAVSNVMVELQPDFSSLIDGGTSLRSGSGKAF